MTRVRKNLFIYIGALSLGLFTQAFAPAIAAPSATWQTVVTGVTAELTGNVVTSYCSTAAPGHYLMLTPSGSLFSSDGHTWPSTTDGLSQNFPPDAQPGFNMTCAVWANAQFVALNSESASAVFFSTEALVWTPVFPPPSPVIPGYSLNLGGIAWSGSAYFVAAAAFGSSNSFITVITSSDGQTWTQVNNAAGGPTGLLTSQQAGTTSIAARGLWYAAGHFYLLSQIAGPINQLYESTDSTGTTFNKIQGVPATVFNGAPVGPGFAVLTSVSTGYITQDGTTWTPLSTTGIPTGTLLNAIAYDDGVTALAGGDGSGNGVIYTSTDDANWTAASIGAAVPGTLYTIAADGCHGFIAGGAGGDVVFGNVTGPAPTATNATLTVTEGQSATSTLIGTAPVSCDTLTYAVAAAPTHGTLSLTDASTGAYTYTPASNYSGTDSFTFTVADKPDGIVSSAATVTITVTAASSGGGSGGSGGSSGGGALGILSLAILLTAVGQRRWVHGTA